MLSYNPQFMKKLYPDWVKASEAQKVERPATEEDLNSETGEWKFTDEISPEEAEKVMAEMLANPAGILRAQDLEKDEEGWV